MAYNPPHVYPNLNTCSGCGTEVDSRDDLKDGLCVVCELENLDVINEDEFEEQNQ